jgi:Fe-S oxidoreductase
MQTVAPQKEIIDAIKASGGDAFKYCYQCGMCDTVCPWNRVRNFSMRKIVREATFGLTEIESEEIWRCTTCGKCPQVCPRDVRQIESGVALRRIATEYGVFAEGAKPIPGVAASLRAEGNPFGEVRAKRADWAQGLGVKTMAEGGNADILYWVGCAASYDDRNKKVARAFVKILQAANVNFAILGKEETCTGDAARRAGNEYLFQMLAQENIETLKRYKVKRIVTSCPHCFNTLKNEYPLFGGRYEVMHHSQLIADLLAQGKLKMAQPLGADTFALHDPCYLGRHNGVYQPARAAISAAAGSPAVELPRNHANSFCCGAGGARNWMEESRGTRINQNRAAEVVASSASALAVACPFCMGMMEDGLKAKAAEGARQVGVKDIAEVVAEGIAA